MRNDPSTALIRTVLGGALLLVAVSVMAKLVTAMVAAMSEMTGPREHAAAAVETAPPPPEVPSAPADPIDWSWVPPALAIVFGVLAIGLMVWFVVHRRSGARSARLVAEEIRAAQLERWQKGISAYSETASAITAFETDPETIFIRPLLLDTSEEATAAAFTAFHEADKLHLENVPRDEVLITAFVDAATAAKVAFHRADANARAKAKAGITHTGRKLTPTERRNVERAQRLLAVALDPATAAAHACNAIEKVMELIDGLVEIPASYRHMVMAGIETRHQLALNN